MVVNRWIETATADVFKDGARMLQLRLRDRFRVAVDSQSARLTVSSGYFSDTVQRWLNRWKEFRRKSLPSSQTFYRKTVSKDVDLESDSVLTRVLQAVAVPVLGNVCHVFMHGFNRVQIFGAEKLNQALLHRPDNKGLITVSNHVASMDDPLVIASLLPSNVMLYAQNIRWTLCATDRCFRNPVTSAFFKYVKVLPVSRGDGIYQKGMDMAVSKLNKGGWVHIFPEGTRSRNGGRSIGSIKRGIGRLLLDADHVPVVLPFVHVGMQEVMPIGAKVPRIGKTVTVLVGDPINFDDILGAEEKQNVPIAKLYDAICARIGNHLHKLKQQVERLAVEQDLQSQDYPTKITEPSAHVLQQIDSESLGKESDLQNEDCSTHPKSDQKQSQWNSLQYQNFSNGFPWLGGIMSMINGYTDSAYSMGLASREPIANDSVKDFVLANQELSPLKAWNRFLEANCISVPALAMTASV